LQSERHVLCVHPADLTPDIAYEAALIQQDSGVVLLPLLPAVLHPGIQRLAELLRLAVDQGGLGTVKLIEMELWSRQRVLLGDAQDGKRAAVPGWEVLRRLGGEVAEVTAFTERADVSPEVPLFISGSFKSGGQFQLALRPQQSETRGRLAVTAEKGSAELVWSESWSGPSRLTWQAGEIRGEQSWEARDAYLPLVEVLEQYLARSPKARTAPEAVLTWQDEVRGLELDDAVHRSAERRRSVPLEYPPATEEAGFKGTMTLLGCGLLWVVLVLVILSVWVPWLGWLVLPVLALFLGLQALLWVARRPTTAGMSTVRRK
jgi:hypothetical protein